MVQFELNLDAQFYTYSFFSLEFGYIWVASSYLSFFACIESFLLIGIMHTVKQSVINGLNYGPKLYPHAGLWFGNHYLKWYINTRYISWRLLDNYRRERRKCGGIVPSVRSASSSPSPASFLAAEKKRSEELTAGCIC